jgi:hypothetical protein
MNLLERVNKCRTIQHNKTLVEESNVAFLQRSSTQNHKEIAPMSR